MPEAANSGLVNARDVGGIPLARGGRIRSGVLFRSDGPIAGDSPPDLLPWPPTTIIDLRETNELATAHPLTADGTTIHSLPLLEAVALSELMRADARESGDLTALYSTTVEHGAANLAEVARLVATSTGPALVHCAAGKDRTGVAIAIMLSAVGVHRTEIIADYERTAANMPAVLERFRSQFLAASSTETADLEPIDLSQLPSGLLTTSVPAIEAVLDAVETHEGGAAGWLVANGLTEPELALLRERLVDA
jgi:hypothetical protein